MSSFNLNNLKYIPQNYEDGMYGIASALNTTQTTPKPELNISPQEKKKAVLEEYCKIVRNNEPMITKLFQESLEKFFDFFKNNAENKQKAQDYMFEKIFNVVEESITADNYTIKSFIVAIIKNGVINNILYEPFQKNTINDLNPSVALTQITEKLGEHNEPTKQQGGNETNETYEKVDDTTEKEKVEEIMEWFSSNMDGNIVNDKILNMILLAFARQIEMPKNKAFIYKTITNKIEQEIAETINNIVISDSTENKWFNDERLVKQILHNILSNNNLINNNNDIKRRLIGAFEKFKNGIVNRKPEFFINNDTNNDINYEKLNECIYLSLIGKPIQGGKKQKPKKTIKKMKIRRYTKKVKL